MNIEARFEKISQYADDDAVIIPTRKTAQSAGYDFCAAEDTVIPSWQTLTEDKLLESIELRKHNYDNFAAWIAAEVPLTLESVAAMTKEMKNKVTLVPTGIKCKIPDDYYLQLSVRSSLPLKHWLILGNGVGIIDADYYNNPDNEGHIYFQIINLLPVPVKIKKGECFGQGVLLPYGVCAEEEEVTTTREGGFGSTNDENSGT